MRPRRSHDDDAHRNGGAVTVVPDSGAGGRMFFSLFDPVELGQMKGAGLSAMAVYSVGFFLFWSLCALASILTCYLGVPAGDNPPF